MRIFKRRYRNHKGHMRESGSWHLEFVDHKDIRRRLTAFADREASNAFAARLQRLISFRACGEAPDREVTAWLEQVPKEIRMRFEEIGLIDSRRVAAGKPLTEHLEDFKSTLDAKGGTEKHINMTINRIQKIFDGCHFERWSDIAASRVLKYLAGLRDNGDGISAQTFNYYVSALKQFCTWMVRERRAAESPVSHLTRLNARADRRYERRSLSPEEARRLLSAARTGETVLGMSGQDREMLYNVALETGLRWSELRSLTRSSFDLKADPPTVTVQAAYSKHRREDTLPLRVDTAMRLRDYLALKMPQAKALPMPLTDKGAWMLREDLALARKAWLDEAVTPDERAKCERSDFLKPEDDAGHVLDFHGLRHSFISFLYEARVHPKTAQALARHSTIALTMDRYTHLTVANQTNALEALPDLHVSEEERVRATGTDDVVMDKTCRPKNRPKPLMQSAISCDKLRRRTGSKSGGAGQRKGPKTLTKSNVPGPVEAGSGGRTRTYDTRIMIPIQGG